MKIKSRKMYVEKDTEACMRRFNQFKAQHPEAKILDTKMVKGCDDKTLIIDYETEAE